MLCVYISCEEVAGYLTDSLLCPECDSVASLVWTSSSVLIFLSRTECLFFFSL